MKTRPPFRFDLQRFAQDPPQITPEQITAYFEANKDSEDVQKLIGGLVTPERVTAFLDSDEGRRMLQPRLDQHFSKGLETWKEKTLPGLIEEEVAKRNPAETEEQKLLRQLKADLETEKQARIRESLRNKALSVATEKGLPVALVDFFIGQDEDTTTANLAALEATWGEALEKAVEERFKEGGRKPPGGTPTPSTKNPWSKEHFNLTEQGRLLRDNPELAKQLRTAAGG